MTRRTFSKIVVILIVVPIAVKAWQKIGTIYNPPAQSQNLVETEEDPQSIKRDTLSGEEEPNDE